MVGLKVLLISSHLIVPPVDFCENIMELFNWAHTAYDEITEVTENTEYPEEEVFETLMQAKTYQLIEQLLRRRWHLFKCNRVVDQ